MADPGCLEAPLLAAVDRWQLGVVEMMVGIGALTEATKAIAKQRVATGMACLAAMDALL